MKSFIPDERHGHTARRLVGAAGAVIAMTVASVAMNAAPASSAPLSAESLVILEEADIGIFINAAPGVHYGEVPYEVELFNIGPDDVDSGTFEVAFNAPVDSVSSPDGCTLQSGVVSCPTGAVQDEAYIDFTVAADDFGNGRLTATATLIATVPTDTNALNDEDDYSCDRYGGGLVVC